MASAEEGTRGPVWAIVVAAGSGTRFGRPKQYEMVAGKSVIAWSVETASSVADGVVLVLPPSDVDRPDLRLGVDGVVPGAATRSGSVRAGLAAVPESAELVVVHDGARPAASRELFREVIAAVRAGADAAIPGVAVADTVKRVRDGVVVETLRRDDLVAVQTPQAFRAEALRGAHRSEVEATDDAALVEAAGGRVVVVQGEPGNRKITTLADLVEVAKVLEAR